MILEGAVLGGLGLAVAHRINLNRSDDIKKAKEIKQKWREFSEIALKDDEKYEILEVFIKHYGFDAIISVPIGKKYSNFADKIPVLESAFKSNVAINLAPDKSSIYTRFHFTDKDISEKDNIRFKWFKTLYNMDNCCNKNGETIQISKIRNIKSPNDEVVGYSLMCKLPLGIDFDNIKKIESRINRNWTKCFIEFNEELMLMVVDIITDPISDDLKYSPIKQNSPYDFYLAMSYSYESVFTSLKDNPHALITGQSQTGKTVALLTGITNLAYFYNEDDFILFESMISAKQDLRIFNGLRQMQYYANNLKDSLKLFKYLLNLLHDRNALFETSKSFCANMYDWNKKYPKKKLPIVLLVIDEMTLYSPMKGDNDDTKRTKEKCEDILKQLIIEGASAGLNVLFSLQRPDKDSFPPHIKSQCGTRVGFYQGNSASSLVAMDDDRCTHIAHKREAIVKYSKGEKLVKTTFVTHDDIINLLKDKYIGTDHYLKLDNNGKIIEQAQKEGIKDNKKEPRFKKWRKKNGCEDDTDNTSDN